MKKLITVLLLISILSVFDYCYASVPRFKAHVLEGLATGVNYSINMPIVIDYDNDGDMDVLIISKEGRMFFLENLQVE